MRQQQCLSFPGIRKSHRKQNRPNFIQCVVTKQKWAVASFAPQLILWSLFFLRVQNRWYLQTKCLFCWTHNWFHSRISITCRLDLMDGQKNFFYCIVLYIYMCVCVCECVAGCVCECVAGCGFAAHHSLDWEGKVSRCTLALSDQKRSVLPLFVEDLLGFGARNLPKEPPAEQNRTTRPAWGGRSQYLPKKYLTTLQHFTFSM